MPKWITAIFVFFLSTTLLTAKAITVEDVIEKHVAVMETEVNNGHKDKELLAAYLRKGNNAKLEGIERVEGKPCYKVSFDLAAGNKIYYLIDAKSWYVVRRSVSVVGKSLGISTADNRDKRGHYSSSSISEKADN